MIKENNIVDLEELDNCIDHLDALATECEGLPIDEAARESGYVKVDTCYNIAEGEDTEQFICSKCGIGIEDFVEFAIDEDDIKYRFQYVFNFCPECGRKIVCD